MSKFLSEISMSENKIFLTIPLHPSNKKLEVCYLLKKVMKMVHQFCIMTV